MKLSKPLTDREYVDLPLEFMLIDNYPLAARIPLYKTLTTSGDTYPLKCELDPDQELRILLVSSNTRIGSTDKVLSGNQLKSVQFMLPDIEEIDERDGEIEEIAKIIDNPKTKEKWKNIAVTKIPTAKLSYESFNDLVKSQGFHIIHYNGHGHADSSNRSDNSIFFWSDKNKKAPVVAVNPSMLENTLKGSKELQFIYLSCCQGAASEPTYLRRLNSFVGLLDAVISAEVPLALGMRWAISIDNSKSISKSFYKALFQDKGIPSVESALAKARSEAWTYTDKSAWCCPILVKEEF